MLSKQMRRITQLASAPRILSSFPSVRDYIKLYEYDAARLLREHGLRVPRGQVALVPREAYLIAKQMGMDTDGYVVKAQVLGGGRGLGYFKENDLKGGVHIVDTPNDVREIAEKMIKKHLVTKQSGEDGFYCNEVYIVEKLNIIKEMYVAITLDRKVGKPVLIYSPQGGVNIEEVAAKTPELIYKIVIDINKGIDEKDLKMMARNLELEDYEEQTIMGGKRLYELFVERDCTMVEINPMVVDAKKGLVCADSKISIDEGAEFRQKDLADADLLNLLNYKERIANDYDLNYIHIGGNIGCLVNGAGLAMATMDIIHYHGGHPANFLDIGGGAETAQIVQALKLLNNDDEVESILINIFGGIIRCDNLAKAIIEASLESDIGKPIVLRMKGTNAKEARELIKQYEDKLKLHFIEELDLAAQKAVTLSQQAPPTI